jgi:hypothetical protein
MKLKIQLFVVLQSKAVINNSYKTGNKSNMSNLQQEMKLTGLSVFALNTTVSESLKSAVSVKLRAVETVRGQSPLRKRPASSSSTSIFRKIFGCDYSTWN